MGSGASAQTIGPAVLSVAGSAVGSYFGGSIGGALGGMAGGLIGSLIFGRAKTKPLIPDLNMMGSSYGNPIPIIWGSVRLAGTVVWFSDVQIHEHGVGKGGGGQSAYSYWQDASIVFCEGPAHLVKIFLDGKLFLDNTTKLGELTKDNKFHFTVREYQGTEDQMPDWRYDLWLTGQGKGGMTPAQRGLCHLIFQQIDLVGWGGRFPQVTAVWSTNPEYTTIFTKLVPAPSLSTDTGVGTLLGMGSAVDWARNVAYQLSYDGTLRAYDLGTGKCIATNPWAMTGGPGQTFYGGLCVGNGSNLYVWGFGDYVYSVDPISLKVGSGFSLGYAHIGIRQMQTINLGTGDLIVLETILAAEGSWTIDGITFHREGIITIVNFAAKVNTFFNLSFNTVDHYIKIAFGHHDEIYQTTDIWFINSSAFDETGSVMLWKYTSDKPADFINLPILSSIPYVGGVLGLLGLDSAFDFRMNINIPHLIKTFTMAELGVPPGSAPGGVILGGLLYDPSDESLLITGLQYTGFNVSLKWDIATGTTLWIQVNERIQYSGYVQNWDLRQGTAINAFDQGHQVTVFDIRDGTQKESPIAAADADRNFSNGHFNSNSNTLVYVDNNNSLWVAALFRKPPQEIQVATIIADICARVGLDITMIDVSKVTDTVWGYAITTPKSAGAALADLCHTFQIDMVESDYLLKFVPRGQGTVATITQDDLGSLDPRDGSKYWVPRHTQEQELPLLINLKYQDPALDYQPGAAYAKRTQLPVPTVFSKRKLSIDLPIISDNLKATHIAEQWLYTMWAERETYQTVWSAKYLDLDPTDNVTVVMDNGDGYTVRIESTELGADFSIHPTLASEDASTYGGSTSRGALFGAAPQTITQSPYGELLLFNVPLLRDDDDLGGVSSRIYFGVGATAAGWKGGGLYNSVDGATWPLVSLLPRAANWGTAENALGDTSAKFATDYINTLRVIFLPGGTVPSSCAYLDLMNGANPILVGSEIVQFQTIEDNGDGSFILSVLIRGCRGTEWATGTHQPGERVILLEPAQLAMGRLPLTELNLNEAWRLVPTGRFLDQGVTRNFVSRGYDLMPYAPINFTRMVSGADLVLGWTRRTRMGGLLMDGIDTVPLNEETEAYEAYVLPDAAAMTGFNPVMSTLPHRYWRLSMFTAMLGKSYAMAEVEFRTTVGTALGFSGGVADASQSFPYGFNVPGDATQAASAIDGDPATFWLTTNGGTQWWSYDYGDGITKNIVEVIITRPLDTSWGDAPVDFMLQWSDDNAAWNTVKTFSAHWTSAGQTRRFGAYRRGFTGLGVPSATYTAAQMAADGFDPATDSLALAVYQLSGMVGRGFPGIEALPAF